MWYVNNLFDQGQVESLSAKGFLVRSSGGVVRIEKYDCGAELRKTPESRYQMTVIPTIMMCGQFTRLWDAGYQKFLLSNEGKKYPVLVEQLANLRRFNEELRTALGGPPYYNEASSSPRSHHPATIMLAPRNDLPVNARFHCAALRHSSARIFRTSRRTQCDTA